MEISFIIQSCHIGDVSFSHSLTGGNKQTADKQKSVYALRDRRFGIVCLVPTCGIAYSYIIVTHVCESPSIVFIQVSIIETSHATDKQTNK
jgi:hypothetical protein